MNLSVEILEHSTLVEVPPETSVIVELGSTGPTGSMPIVGHVYEQPTPSAVWVIEHPLPFHPTVSVWDSSGSQVHGEPLPPGPTFSPVVIRFSAAFSGTASLS